MKREHAPALERLIARLRESGADEVAGWYEALLADTPDARKVRDWFKKHGRPNLGGLRRMSGDQDCEDWEAELFSLVKDCFLRSWPVTELERQPKSYRQRKAATAAAHARALAKALDDIAGPPIPSVLSLFDPERAVDIIRALPSKAAKELLAGTGYSVDPKGGYQRTEDDEYFRDHVRLNWAEPAWRLANYFQGTPTHAGTTDPPPQLLPSILLRLSQEIEWASVQPPRLPRPNGGNADAIAFARLLARHFQHTHGVSPCKEIAALVVIKYPDTVHPGERTIQEWCGIKPANKPAQ